MRQALHRIYARGVRGRRIADLTPLEREYLPRAAHLFEYFRANGIREGRDILALAATFGRHRFSSALDLVACPMSSRRFRAVFDRRHLLNLASLLADQPRDDRDREGAIAILTAMADQLGVDALLKEGRFRLVELLVAAGRVGDLDAMLDRMHIGRDDFAQAHLLRANAFRADRVRLLNELLSMEGLEPTSGDTFDALTSEAPRHAAGPQVTVIIPTFNPGARIATAINSVRAQSHANLQILIMDDASAPEQGAALEDWARVDSRITVVHLPENRGPYIARNIAVERYATGGYVTVHDDDDWSHPRRIERQVAHLETNPDEVANMVNAVRTSDDLVFGRVNGNPVWTQHALSSLLVRRELFEKIGFWDALNRSADAEFNDRIRVATESRITVVGRVPLALYRVRWDSLSASEFDHGYMDDRRRWYRSAYSRWHRHEIAAGRVPHVPADDRGRRPFSAPVDLQGQRGASIQVAQLVVDDFRTRRTPIPEGDVALLQLDDPRVDATLPISDAVLASTARIVGVLDVVEAESITIGEPEILAFRPDLRERFGHQYDTAGTLGTAHPRR